MWEESYMYRAQLKDLQTQEHSEGYRGQRKQLGDKKQVELNKDNEREAMQCYEKAFPSF